MPSSAGSRLALALGLAAGSAGVGMLLWWRRRTLVAASPPEALSLATALDSAAPKEAPAHGKQRQILEKLDELLSLLEELREEVRELAAAVPRLKERVQAELTGRAPERRPSPQHRARRRRPTPTPSSGTDHSSEEGGCYREDQNPSDRVHPELSQAYPPTEALRRLSGVSSSSSVSFFSTHSSFSLPLRRPLLTSIRKNLLSREPSRANFDFREDRGPGSPKAPRRYSVRRVSVVRCYESTLDDLRPQACGTQASPPSPGPETSRRRGSLWAPEYQRTYLGDLEPRPSCSCCYDRRGSAVPLVSLPTIISRSCQHGGVLTGLEDAQPRRTSLFCAAPLNLLSHGRAASECPCPFCSASYSSRIKEEGSGVLPPTRDYGRHLPMEASRIRSPLSLHSLS